MNESGTNRPSSTQLWRRSSQQPTRHSQRKAILVSFLLLLVIACEGFLPVIATPKPATSTHPTSRRRRRSTLPTTTSTVQKRQQEIYANNAGDYYRNLVQRLRGGVKDATAASSLVAAPFLFCQSLFLRFSTFVGSSRHRCMALLITAILVESGSTLLSKRAKDTGSVLVFLQAAVLYLLCMVGFNVSLAQMNVSVAYALWSAIGTTLVTTAGIVFFGESLDPWKFLFLVMIVVGVVGLNLKG